MHWCYDMMYVLLCGPSGRCMFWFAGHQADVCSGLQAIKQMYVLVLGLDVLGNPFGLLRGMAEGIEDLFYEPYQVGDIV